MPPESAVLTADASTAQPPAQAPVSTAPSDTPFAEQQKSWTREEMSDWRLTGREPAPKTKPAPAEAPAERTETHEPSATKVGTEAATETADEDQELPEGDSVEDRRKRAKIFAKLRHDRSTFKAERDLLRDQSKEKPARIADSAPAPTAKPAEKAPEKFKFREPTETETMLEYMDARDDARDDFNRKRWSDQSKAERESEREQETVKQREERLVSEFIGRRETFLKKGESESTEDHRLRALQYANASRWFTGQTEGANALHVEEAILESEHGHRLMLHYHGHQEEFAALLKQTPSSALRTIGRLESTFEKKAPELKPKTRTSAPDPGDRVESASSASGDPIAEAYAKYDQTKDQKYMALAMKLENEKEIARLTRK